jgi:hypothetical protein
VTCRRGPWEADERPHRGSRSLVVGASARIHEVREGSGRDERTREERAMNVHTMEKESDVLCAPPRAP